MENKLFLITVSVFAGKIIGIPTTTNYVTYTYDGGDECLPYDGSEIPDCEKFLDPITKEPYFVSHATSKSDVNKP